MKTEKISGCQNIIKDPAFKKLLKKMPMLFLGFVLFAIGILLTLYADLGMGPWDVFHKGVSHHIPLTLGQVMQVTGVMLLVISYFLGEKPGLGSIFNMYFIGLFVDIIDGFGIFFTPENLLLQFIMLILGIQAIGWATYCYLRVQLGAGPRDGLMVGIVKHTNKPVWLIRGIIETTVLIIGYFLGGPVGIGTVIIALTIGFSVQLAFKIGGYNAKKVRHQNLVELLNELRRRKSSSSSSSEKTSYGG
ncbi:YczE/YyaS/YitT family protein [Natranaerobius thermophilus]|nr:membrane protein [Natranaerobius thermophilus]